MKKILSLVLSLLLLLTLSACREDAPDSSPSGDQNGTVDTPATGEPAEDSKVYDTDGNLILEKILDADGVYIGKREYTYENGKQVTCTEYDAEDELVVKYTYRYDGNVLLQRHTALYNFGVVDATEEAEFAEDGKIVKESFFDSTGTLWQVTEYVFDADRDQVGYKAYSYENGSVKSCVSYDEDDHVLSEEQYNENGEVFWSIRYEYMDGLRVKGVESDGSYHEYHYDKEGNETGLTYYDSDGNVTEKIIYEEDTQQAE